MRFKVSSRNLLFLITVLFFPGFVTAGNGDSTIIRTFTYGSPSKVSSCRLLKGCYRLIIRNAQGEGLRYWANMPPYGNGTAGYARLNDMQDDLVKNFQSDFGSFVAQAFTVGVAITNPGMEGNRQVTVYPNPSSGVCYISTSFLEPVSFDLIIMDGIGRQIKRTNLVSGRCETIPVDLSGQIPGVYTISLQSSEWVITKKIIIF